MLIGHQGLDFKDNFYPDDLPKDWIFDYYSNEFNCVLLQDLKPIDDIEDAEDYSVILEANNKTIANKNILFWQQCNNTGEAKQLLEKNENICIQSDKNLDLKLPLYKFENIFIYANKKPIILLAINENDRIIKTQLETLAKLHQDIIIIFKKTTSKKLATIKVISELLGL